MKITKVRLSDQVANEIQNMISSKQYVSGDKLPVEKELAQMYSVSRVTVREAISKLCMMDIIDVRQGDGTFVKSLSPMSFMKPLIPMLSLDKKDLHDIFEVRMLIECKASELAALLAAPEELHRVKVLLDKMDLCVMSTDIKKYDELDVKFHYEVAKCSHNRVIIIIHELLMEMIKDSIIASTSPNALANSLVFHKKVYEALLEHDGEAAASLMKAHIEGGANYIKNNL